jgi:TolB-like protein/Tfp pilus assembly protein PilF
MSEPGKAVFLSYAREDAEAVRRVADALRAFSIEVWFDQNELRGGDSWDQKIRRQIRECALFVPVISATTQARGEGYFRREWKLGVDRTHDMAGGVAFIMPVVIDETLESDALVPEEFMRYQWTRLPHGVPSPEFVMQVKRLLEAPRGAAPDRTHPPVLSHPPTHSPVSPPKGGLPKWIWAAVAIVAVGAVAAWFGLHKPVPAAEPPQPVAAVAPAAAVPAAMPAVNEKSIAVLPFENMSAEKESAFFADGIHEDLLTNLALVRELHVVSRTSVMQYRGTTKSIRDIGRELGVAYVLEGSVQRAGNKVRVTGQLINARTDEHVWAKAYDRDLTDIFTIQSELSQEIAGALAAALSPQEKALLERRPTENLAAYDAYVKARQMILGGVAEGTNFPVIESLLKKAVGLDPNFADAWAELGRASAFAYFNETDRSAERLEQARDAIETAVRLAPDAPEVIEKYGDYFYYGFRDYTRATEQYQRLAVLRPNDASVFGSLGLIHRRQGRWSEALADLRRSIELEPRNLRYLRALQQLAQALDRYDEAEAVQRRMVELMPGDLFESSTLYTVSFLARGSTKEMKDWLARTKPDAEHASLMLYGQKLWAMQSGDLAEAIRLDGVQRYFDGFGFPRWGQDISMAFVLEATGDHASARARAEQALPAIKAELDKKPSASAWSALGGVYIIVGNKEEALRCAKNAMEMVPESTDAVAGPGLSLNYASTLAWVGEKDRALTELARLLRTPYGENIYTAKASLNWLPLRGDPRFEALVNDPKNNAPMF